MEYYYVIWFNLLSIVPNDLLFFYILLINMALFSIKENST